MMDIPLLTRQIADLEATLAEYEALRDQHKIYFALTGKIRFCKQTLEVCLAEAIKPPKIVPQKLPMPHDAAAKRGRPKKVTPAQEVKSVFAPVESLSPPPPNAPITIQDLIPIEWNLTPNHKKVFVYLFEADSRLSTFEEIHSAYADKDYCAQMDFMAVSAVLKNLQRTLKRFSRDILIYTDHTACLDVGTLDYFSKLMAVRS